MTKKDFLLEMGERTEKPVDTDTLLNEVVVKRKRREVERQEEKDEAKHKADMAGYKKQESTAESAVEKAGEKKDESTTGFKLTGSMNVGNIDLQQERKDAIENTERLRQEAADGAARTAQENNTLRAEIHTAEMREFKAINEAALATITAKMETRSATQIIADIRSTAAELGLKPPDPGASDPALQIRMLELQHAETARDREFQWQMQRDRDEREDKKAERADSRAALAAQLTHEEKKLDLLKQAPTMIGNAIGQAVLGGGSSETPPSISRESKQHYVLEVPQGQGGDTTCPSCQSPVGVGPTAKTAVCANCETKISIKRMQPKGDQEPIQGAETQTAETDKEE